MEKPGRYINGELNSVHRSPDGRLSIALAYPDVYEVGLSNLGLQILYELINERDDCIAERTYAPWMDMEAEMRRSGVPLFTLEGHRSVADFDIVGFTLQYELTYANILNMLDLAGIPVFAADRGEASPLVIGGGPGAFAPEPLALFFDAFAIGDGELLLPDLIDAVLVGKRAGAGRKEILAALARIPGIYVPSLYEVDYLKDGRVAEISARSPAPDVVKRRILKDLNDAPLLSAPIVPSVSAVHDRCVIEIMRGCTRGCRFCQAGIIYRPVRERREERIVENASRVIASTGYEELSLSSLSTADHTGVKEVLTELARRYGRDVALSLPSLRVDSFSVELIRQIAKSKRSGLTFAPEAGTQRLRDVINKGVTETDLLEAAEAAFESGWHRLKLYFMIGLPNEGVEDLEGIVSLTRRVADLGRCALPRTRRGRLSVVASISSFVPKAHTPFQWFAQEALEVIEQKQRFLQENLRGRGLSLRWHDARVSTVEGIIARGDRRAGRAIYEAWRSGCKFDAWADHFNFGAWLAALGKTRLSPEFFATRERELDETLPWSHIDAGVTADFLKKERERALAGTVTADCRFDRCGDCGVCSRFKVKNVLARGRKERVSALN